MAARLDGLVLYQAYPQSFADGNGDGIGDLIGLRERLDYLSWLGVDAVWLNPCFVSPFRDAGYDVADYLQVAPRYGSNDDLAALCEAAAARGIGIVLDLVAGHTSDEHPWFRRACRADASPADRDRYLWSPQARDGWVRAPGDAAEQWYLPNFLPFQPALNYGYARLSADEPWRQPVDAPGPQRNREALKQIMAFWFDRGVSGFRVDMAASLVKDDIDLVETRRLWGELRAWVDEHYPGRLLIAEWGNPALSVPAGFHVDMFLHFGGPDNGLPLRSLWQNGGGTVSDHWPDHPCWADAEGSGSVDVFATAWHQARSAIGGSSGYGRDGIVGLPTANHDFSRLVAGNRDADQARVALTLVFTWATMPCVYYGDEIGLPYRSGLRPFEGSRLEPRFERAGSRTPLPWGDLAGTPFAATAMTTSYLPVDDTAGAPTVTAQYDDPDSLLALVRSLIALRHTDARLAASAPLRLVTGGYPAAYLRGEDESLLVVLNPARRATSLSWSSLGEADPRQRRSSPLMIVGRGMRLGDRAVELDGFGYAVIELDSQEGNDE